MDENKKQDEIRYEEVLDFSKKFCEVKHHIDEWTAKQQEFKDNLRSLKAEVRDLERSSHVEGK